MSDLYGDAPLRVCTERTQERRQGFCTVSNTSAAMAIKGADRTDIDLHGPYGTRAQRPSAGVKTADQILAKAVRKPSATSGPRHADAGVMVGGEEIARTEGTPQGSSSGCFFW